jgi:hypothetical protein
MANWSWVLQPPGSPQRGRFEAAMREAGIQARLDIIETASPIAITALLELRHGGRHAGLAGQPLRPAGRAAHGAAGAAGARAADLPHHPEDRALSPAAAQFRRQLLGGTISPEAFGLRFSMLYCTN